MSVKILTVFICAAVGTATGYAVLLRYKKIDRYFEGVCGVISELKKNLAYRRDAAVKVLSSVSADGLLKKQIEEYGAFVQSKDSALEISRGFLPADAHAKVTALFGSLGCSDEKTQLGELDMNAETFGSLKRDAADKLKKLGPLAVKLGFLFGLGVGVLFL